MVVDFSPNAASTLVVPLIRAPVTVKFTAVAVPVSAGLARGARNNTSELLALLFKLVSTLLVPLMSAPDTVKFMAVAVPVSAGLTKDAF